MNIVRTIRRALREDPILDAIVGKDKDGEVKVYTPLGKANITAPYVTFGIVPIGGPIPVYGDSEVLEDFEVGITSWGRTSIEAWDVADAADDAIKLADYSFEPWELVQVIRTTTPEEAGDRDTDLRQVRVRYRFMLGR